MGWGPVQISVVLGGMSILIAAGFASVSFLSGNKVKASDESLVMFGVLLNAVSYTGLYFGWQRNGHAWQYYLPIGGAAVSFPFLAVPTRTIFTRGVNAQPSLKQSQGTMQAVLSMFASVAGFTVPALVASHCNRHPEDITLSETTNPREMSSWTLVAPLMAVAVLVGVLYIVHQNGTHCSAEEKEKCARTKTEKKPSVEMETEPEEHDHLLGAAT